MANSNESNLKESAVNGAPENVEDVNSNGPDNEAPESTLKLVINKTHLGPFANKGSKRALLSKAGNKVRLSNDLKVKLSAVSESDQGNSEKRTSNTDAQVFLIKDGSSALSATSAIAFIEAYDKLYGGATGTGNYLEKSNALASARNEAYTELGFSPINVSNSKKAPVLTEDQRMLYNAKVQPHAFWYYEIYLSWKVKGKKVVRTKTYRFLQRPDANQIVNRLTAEAERWSSKYEVTIKEVKSE